MNFNLNETLKNDSIVLGEFPLTLLLRIKDDNYPWYILVPKVDAIKEIYELSDSERKQFYQESHDLSLALKNHYKADKLNIASIGNMVPQLHVHHIARFKDDPSWPKPVWGTLPMKEIDKEKFLEDSEKLISLLNLEFKIAL